MKDRDGVEWMTVAQAAERFRLKEATIRQWIRRGVLAGDDLKRYRRYVVVSASAVANAEWHLRTTGPRPGVRRVAD